MYYYEYNIFNLQNCAYINTRFLCKKDWPVTCIIYGKSNHAKPIAFYDQREKKERYKRIS